MAKTDSLVFLCSKTKQKCLLHSLRIRWWRQVAAFWPFNEEMRTNYLLTVQLVKKISKDPSLKHVYIMSKERLKPVMTMPSINKNWHSKAKIIQCRNMGVAWWEFHREVIRKQAQIGVEWYRISTYQDTSQNTLLAPTSPKWLLTFQQQHLRMLWREKDLKSVMKFEREISMYGQDVLWEFLNIAKHFQAQTSLELGQSIHHDFKGLFQNVSSPTRKVPTASPPWVAGTKCYLENWTENLCTWRPKVREL